MQTKAFCNENNLFLGGKTSVDLKLINWPTIASCDEIQKTVILFDDYH